MLKWTLFVQLFLRSRQPQFEFVGFGFSNFWQWYIQLSLQQNGPFHNCTLWIMVPFVVCVMTGCYGPGFCNLVRHSSTIQACVSIWRAPEAWDASGVFYGNEAQCFQTNLSSKWQNNSGVSEGWENLHELGHLSHAHPCTLTVLSPP